MTAIRHLVKVPHLGDCVGETLIVEWVTAVASWVDQGGALAVVEVDKVDVEVPSAVAGVLVEQLVEVGATVAVGEPFCVIES